MSTKTPVDGRSIGELLLDADYQARQLLMDVTGDDAAAMLRTWGEVVEAAADLWRALPAPTDAPVDGVTVTRLEHIARTQHRAQLRRNWPGEGPSDERLLGIAETLQRATDLALGPGKDVQPRDKAARADLNAARMRLMHTLYVGTHAVGVAVHHHVQYIRWATEPHELGHRRRRRPSNSIARGISRGTEAARRLAAAEELAGGYLGHRFSQVIRGEHYTPPWGTGRLQAAFATWDVQAHRTLTASATVTNLALVAHTQAVIATGSTAILAAGCSTGGIDADTYQLRLAPVLDSTQRAWTRAAARWDELSSRGQRADPDLMRAANEVRAAVHQIAFDGIGWATPQVIAARVNLPEATAATHQAIVAATEVACVHRDAVDQPDLAGSVHTVAAWMFTNATVKEIARSATSLPSPRSASDTRQVAIPAAMRRSLTADADQLVVITSVAASAGSALIGRTRQPIERARDRLSSRPGGRSTPVQPSRDPQAGLRR